MSAGDLAVLSDQITLLDFPQHLVLEVREAGALHPDDLLDSLDPAVQPGRRGLVHEVRRQHLIEHLEPALAERLHHDAAQILLSLRHCSSPPRIS